MNILILNHYAGSPHHGMEFRPYYMAREWILAGHNVKIVAASHSHIRAIQPEMDCDEIKDVLIDGINYSWYFTSAYNGNGVGRVWNILTFIYRLWMNAERLVNDFKPDVVIASSTYPMDIWPARKIANLSGAKLVYEVHDLWPLSPIELGGMSRWHPFIIWVQWAEDYAFKHSDCVVSMLPKTLDYMISRGLAAEKWFYVPNGVDLIEWQSSSKLSTDLKILMQKIRSRGLPIVGYAGTHGLANSLDLLLDAAALLNNEAEFILVGTGPEREHLMNRVTKESLKNVTMLSAIPKAEIPEFLSLIDIAYIGLMSQPLFRFGISPNKLFDYMMAGKPIVQSISAGNDVVTEVGCGITVEPGRSDLIAQAIRTLLKLDNHSLQILGEKGKKYVIENRTYSVLSQKFLEAVGV